jgi:hypothetical protein
MPIIAAVHYKNLEGEWATGGWFSLQPGQTKEVARTRNTFFYVSLGGRRDWGGGEQALPGRLAADVWGAPPVGLPWGTLNPPLPAPFKCSTPFHTLRPTPHTPLVLRQREGRPGVQQRLLGRRGHDRDVRRPVRGAGAELAGATGGARPDPSLPSSGPPAPCPCFHRRSSPLNPPHPPHPTP